MLKVIQITDSHLLQDPNKQFFGVNPYRSLKMVLRSIKEEPDLIVFTGDISQDGSTKSYKYATDLLRSFKCPIIWTAGNHDSFSCAKSCLKSFKYKKSYSAKNWLLIVLNSYWKNHIEGRLSSYNFLLKTLKKNPAKNVAIFVHHPVHSINSKWLDKIGLVNREEFFRKIKPFKNIRVIFCGHVHQEFKSRRKNMTIYTTPSTSFQFKNSDDVQIDAKMPGYRLIEFGDDGSIKTGVKRVDFSRDFMPGSVYRRG